MLLSLSDNKVQVMLGPRFLYDKMIEKDKWFPVMERDRIRFPNGRSFSSILQARSYQVKQ